MKLFLFLIFLAASGIAFSQNIIRGKVISDKGQPLPNASVFLPNSTKGVYTNDKGEFVLNNIPSGNIIFAITYVGYEATTISVPADARNKEYIVKLKLQSNDLQTVIIKSYDREGWKKWGNIFTDAFIGTSSYAGDCVIRNKDIVRFVYSDAAKQLHAFCNEPLIIENKDLGYKITVTLVDFYYDLSSRVVDYQTYALFTEMQGSEDEMTAWKKNRLKVYALSLLHFMRSLYANQLTTEGYQVQLIERKINLEKGRVQKLYQEAFNRISDSLSISKSKERDVNKLVEHSFAKDSLTYYQSTLMQKDGTEKIKKKAAGFDDIAKQKDSITVALECRDYMQVTYTRMKEPEEYFEYKNESLQENNTLSEVVNNTKAARTFPATELNLQQGLPVEVSENGYFTNTDLFMNGFWGWWEKMSTKLPYDYTP